MTEHIVMVIAGGRDRAWSQADVDWLDSLPKPTIILTGGNGRTDSEAILWASTRGIGTGVFRANWDYYGAPAGPIRNRYMALLATHAAIFQGGDGTADMLKQAKRAGLTIYMREGVQ